MNDFGMNYGRHATACKSALRFRLTLQPSPLDGCPCSHRRTWVEKDGAKPIAVCLFLTPSQWLTWSTWGPAPIGLLHARLLCCCGAHTDLPSRVPDRLRIDISGRSEAAEIRVADAGEIAAAIPVSRCAPRTLRLSRSTAFTISGCEIA